MFLKSSHTSYFPNYGISQMQNVGIETMERVAWRAMRSGGGEGTARLVPLSQCFLHMFESWHHGRASSHVTRQLYSRLDVMPRCKSTNTQWLHHFNWDDRVIRLSYSWLEDLPAIMNAWKRQQEDTNQEYITVFTYYYCSKPSEDPLIHQLASRQINGPVILWRIYWQNSNIIYITLHNECVMFLLP